MTTHIALLGDLTKIRTGKLDANASSIDGQYPFFTCAREPLRINSYSYDCECVLVAGNGDLNVKYHNGRFDAYQRTYIVEPIGGKLDCRYLYHFLDSYLDELRKLSIGGVIKYIKIGNLTEARIPLPPLEEQRRIAAILDKAAMVREQATQSLAATSRALYDSIFSRDILAAHHRMARIGDIAEQLPSGYGSDPGRLPFAAPVAKVSNVTADGRFHRGFESRSFTQSELERLLVGEHDLLVVKSSGSKANIISGKTAICGKNEAGVLVASNFLMRLCIDRSAADPRFVWHILNSRISKDFVKKVAGTTTYPNLKWSTYVDHPIPLPSLSEQLLIRERLDCIDALSHEKGARLAEKAGDLIAVLQQQLIGR